MIALELVSWTDVSSLSDASLESQLDLEGYDIGLMVSAGGITSSVVPSAFNLSMPNLLASSSPSKDCSFGSSIM